MQKNGILSHHFALSGASYILAKPYKKPTRYYSSLPRITGTHNHLRQFPPARPAHQRPVPQSEFYHVLSVKNDLLAPSILVLCECGRYLRSKYIHRYYLSPTASMLNGSNFFSPVPLISEALPRN